MAKWAYHKTENLRKGLRPGFEFKEFFFSFNFPKTVLSVKIWVKRNGIVHIPAPFDVLCLISEAIHGKQCK